MKKIKKNQSVLMLKDLSIEFSGLLTLNNINGNVKVNSFDRLFTETMYDGKYHFSQINNPTCWSFFNEDCNIILSTNGNLVELFNIEIANTGKGLGTQILNLLLDAADNKKIRINLNAVPTEVTGCLEEYHLNNKTAGEALYVPLNNEITKGTDRLVDYYNTLGFKTYGRKFQMIYVPQNNVSNF